MKFQIKNKNFQRIHYKIPKQLKKKIKKNKKSKTMKKIKLWILLGKKPWLPSSPSTHDPPPNLLQPLAINSRKILKLRKL